RLAALGDWVRWPPPRNPQEGYVLCVEAERAWVVATTARGCLYGCQTLLQLIRTQPGEAGSLEAEAGRSVAESGAEVQPESLPSAQASRQTAKPSSGARLIWLPGVWIVDWPQLSFRGVHLCIFPNTELPAIRQAILWAARFKCNAVVIEPWASLRSRRRPETAYPHAYSPEEVRPLVLLGRALHMEMIPMLNSWGHASGMRSRSGEHVVLDRFPQFRDLYEADGWSFRLANPAIYEHLFDRYAELLELFGPVRYFHVGMDEAWGHLGAVKLDLPAGKEPHQLAAEHLLKLHRYFAERKIQILMWHDMLVRRGDPELGGAGPANSIPPYNTHLALEKLPRDIIIAAWNYDVAGAWPIPKYFRDKGFPVVVCPWKSRPNTIFLVNLAKELDLLGVLATTWDSLDVSLPSVAQAAVLAWEEPKTDLLRIPFDHWLAEIRKLPISNLPQLEATLQPASPEKAGRN
ncbi:MAG: beta-N-acetylhexosaminidase, partial [Thermoguttaceae bacterium]|nr:beta-N-acetylhexosaminidase [Thermoguttaceae bacterium]MDW8038227.1 family 20 glycosylhydrolase [Thermoguttaceae bacterium]